MNFTVKQIADLLEAEIVGDPEATITKVSKIEEGSPGSLCFLANEKYVDFLYNTGATAVLISKSLPITKELQPGTNLIKVEDPRVALAILLEKYSEQKSKKSGIHEFSSIGKDTSLGGDIYIGAYTSIGEGCEIGQNVVIHNNVSIGNNVKIGDHCVLYPNVTIYDDSILGQQCTIHGGSVIGSDGFGFAPNQDNQYLKVVHTGNVILEDHVEIGAGTIVDRATMGSTILRRGVKLDNLIQIAHNVEIGENTVIAAQCGVAGSAKIGKNCMIGGQVGIVGHITIADGVKIAAQSGIGHSIKKEGSIVQGSPAFGIGDYKRSYVLFRKLPELDKRIKQLEQELDSLNQTSS